MKLVIVAALLTALGVSACRADTATPKAGARTAKTDREGWPDTHEGRVARRWVEAFSAGDSAMRHFITHDLPPEALARKSVEERMATYRKSHERFGTLALASVVRSSPGELTLSLMASDATLHEFTFDVETKSPYRIVQITTKEVVSGHSSMPAWLEKLHGH